jgi:hypothetical protein
MLRDAQDGIVGERRHDMFDADLVLCRKCAPCKGGDLQWVEVPPGDGSLQPEAIGAAEEVTSPPKPLMERDISGVSASIQA